MSTCLTQKVQSRRRTRHVNGQADAVDGPDAARRRHGSCGERSVSISAMVEALHRKRNLSREDVALGADPGGTAGPVMTGWPSFRLPAEHLRHPTVGEAEPKLDQRWVPLRVEHEYPAGDSAARRRWSRRPAPRASADLRHLTGRVEAQGGIGHFQHALPFATTTCRLAVIPGSSTSSGFSAVITTTYVTMFCTICGALRICFTVPVNRRPGWASTVKVTG